MRLSIDFSHGELHQLLDDITPFRFHLGQEQWLEFASPSHSEMLPDYGLRVTAKGRVRLSALTVPVILDVRKTTVVFEPVIIGEPGAQRLAFAVNVERLDFEKIPAFLEAVAERKLSKMLSANETALVFDFAALMSRDLGITPKIVPLQQLRLQTIAGAVEVRENGVRLDVQLNSRIVASPTRAEGSELRAPSTQSDEASQAPTRAATSTSENDASEANVAAPSALGLQGADEFSVVHEV